MELNETEIRFEALTRLREIQSQLVGISFLEVIAIMKEDNPLKKDVLTFQDELDKLTSAVGEFVSKSKNDVDYQLSDDEKEQSAEEEIKEHYVYDSSASIV